jgi:hypothetical protein
VTAISVSSADPSGVTFANLGGWTVYNLRLDANISALSVGTIVDPPSSSRCIVEGCYIHDTLSDVGVWLAGANSGSISNTIVMNSDMFVGADARVAYSGFPRNIEVTNNWVRNGSITVGATTSAESQFPVDLCGIPMTNVVVTHNTIQSSTPASLQYYYANGRITNNYIGSGRSSHFFSCAVANSRVYAPNIGMVVVNNVTVSNNQLCESSQYVIGSIDVPRIAYSPYSNTNPTFNQAAIQQQLANGSILWQNVLNAARDLNKSSYEIQAGDYGFNPNVSYPAQGWYCANLIGIQRPDNNPFSIVANGEVTFWMNGNTNRAPNVNIMMAIFNSNNISVSGLTFDAYHPQSIEGTVAAIDIPGNRIAVDLLANTFSNSSSISNITETSGGSNLSLSQYRIIPGKPDGALITSLYKVDSSWGPGNLWLKDYIRPDGSVPNRYWYTFKKSTLLQTIYTPAWYDTFGLRGTLCLGDVVSIPLTTLMNFAVYNSRNITLSNCKCYLGFIADTGGDGGHLFKNLWFAPRPGTNRLLTASGQLGGRQRVGSTFDNCYFGFSSDDNINIFGMNNVQATTISGENVTMQYMPSGTRAGDFLEFFDTTSGIMVGRYEIASAPSGQTQPYPSNRILTLTTTPNSNILSTDVKAYYPNTSSAGWAIRNCTFESTYQRIYIQTGPGEISNTIVRGLGQGIELDSWFNVSVEGGFSNNIVISNNAFLECGHGYGVPVIWQLAGPRSNVRNLIIRDNAFLGCGGSAVSMTNAQDTLIERNVVIDPLRRNLMANMAPGPTPFQNSGGASNVVVRDNQVVYVGNPTRGTVDPIFNGLPFAGVSVSNNVVISDVNVGKAYLAGYSAYSSGGSATDIVNATKGALFT